MAVALTLAGAVIHGAPPARAETASAPIPVELNKLEPLSAQPDGAGGGCRAYMVITNPDSAPIAQLRLDLILFGTDGVILRRLALDLAPLGPRKTLVRPFDVQGQPCDGIGRMLINDVLACQVGPQAAGNTAGGTPEERQACLDRLQPTSRAKAELAK